MARQEIIPVLTVEHFADRMHTLHARYMHAPDSSTANRVHVAWRRLDGVTSAQPAVHKAPQRTYAAIGRVSEVMGDAVGRQDIRKALPFYVAPVCLEAALDEVDQGLHTPGAKLGDLRLKIDAALDYSHITAGRRGVEAKNLSYSAISARALRAHIQAREIITSTLPAEAKRTMTDVVQATIWGLAKDTVQLARSVAAHSDGMQALGLHPGNLPGKSVEAMYLAYRFLDWHAAEAPSVAYSRFGFLREDRPLSRPEGPPRNIDIVTRYSDATELVQVKAGRNGSSPPEYAPGVIVWAPARNALQYKEQIFSWFDTVLANESSEQAVQLARHNLRNYFEGNHFEAGRPLDR